VQPLEELSEELLELSEELSEEELSEEELSEEELSEELLEHSGQDPPQPSSTPH
jgi:hypothetical protein